MQILATIVLGLAILDLFATPFILSVIRKNGGFHYLISTLHKFVFLILIAVLSFVFYRNCNITGSNFILMVKLVIPCVLVFSFVKTLELDDYFLRQFEPEKYDTNNISEEGRTLMLSVFEDMNNMNKKSFTQRFKGMSNNFLSNIMTDIEVVFMIVTSNTKAKNAYLELQKLLGYDTKFATKSIKDLIFLVKTRIIIDSLTIGMTVLFLVSQ